jgi:hypothetical protein
MDKINGYTLSRNYFEWAFNNPDRSDPVICALYFFIIDEFNRSKWKDKIYLYRGRCMDAIGCKSPKTYRRAYLSLIEAGFIKIITKSPNQYRANEISLGNPNYLEKYRSEVEETPEETDTPDFAEVKNTQANINGGVNFTQENETGENAGVNGEVKNTQANDFAGVKNATPNTPILNNKNINTKNNKIEGEKSPSTPSDDLSDFEVFDPYKEFNKWINENTPSVAKLKNQITESQYDKLSRSYDLSDIYKELESMENYQPLTKKYTSVYLTLKKWLEMDKDRVKNKGTNGSVRKSNYSRTVDALQEMLSDPSPCNKYKIEY